MLLKQTWIRRRRWDEYLFFRLQFLSLSCSDSSLNETEARTRVRRMHLKNEWSEEWKEWSLLWFTCCCSPCFSSFQLFLSLLSVNKECMKTMRMPMFSYRRPGEDLEKTLKGRKNTDKDMNLFCCRLCCLCLLLVTFPVLWLNGPCFPYDLFRVSFCFSHVRVLFLLRIKIRNMFRVWIVWASCL